jgi:hypothetical protein
MMKHVVFAAVAALVLGGCNKSPNIDAKNATPAEVAQKVQEAGADQSFVHPGLWRSTVTIEKFDMPGVPPDMVRRMKAMMAENQGHDFETCLTAADVKQPKEDFFAGRSNQCRYDHFTMEGGKIDAVMRCGKGEGVRTMQMIGTFSPERYEMHMATMLQATDEALDAAGHAMQMQMRVESQRIGECRAKRG